MLSCKTTHKATESHKSESEGMQISLLLLLLLLLCSRWEILQVYHPLPGRRTPYTQGEFVFNAETKSSHPHVELQLPQLASFSLANVKENDKVLI